MSVEMAALAFVFLVGLLGALVRVSYELGKDDGWDESARWADHLLQLSPEEFDGVRAMHTPAEDRPAVRDADA